MLGNSTIKSGLRILFVLLAFILLPHLAMAQLTKKKPDPVPTKPVQKTKPRVSPPQHKDTNGKGETGKTEKPDDSRKTDGPVGKKNGPNNGPVTGDSNSKRTVANPVHTGVHPPADSKRESDGKDGAIYKAPNGAEYHANKDGNVDSVTTKSGTEAKFNSRGGVATIHPKNGPTIQSGPGGARRIESTRADGAKVVSDGHGRGYVEKTFTRGDRAFASRTYVVNGHSYTRVYSCGH